MWGRFVEFKWVQHKQKKGFPKRNAGAVEVSAEVCFEAATGKGDTTKGLKEAADGGCQHN